MERDTLLGVSSHQSAYGFETPRNISGYKRSLIFDKPFEALSPKHESVLIGVTTEEVPSQVKANRFNWASRGDRVGQWRRGQMRLVTAHQLQESSTRQNEEYGNGAQQILPKPNTKPPINMENTATHFSFGVWADISPYPTVVMVCIDQYSAVTYRVPRPV